METRKPPRPSTIKAERDGSSPDRRAVPVRSVAAMRSPIFVPARGEAAAGHRTGDIARPGRCAEGGGAGAAGPAARQTAHGRSADENMSRPVPALRFTEQTSQMITRCDRVGFRTRMPRTAAAVHFARGHTRQANMRAFSAPDRPIAVPDRDRRTGKGLASRNDRGEQEQAEYHCGSVMRRADPFKCHSYQKHQKAARSAQRRTRSWRGRSRTACARACGPAAVRQG